MADPPFRPPPPSYPPPGAGAKKKTKKSSLPSIVPWALNRNPDVRAEPALSAGSFNSASWVQHVEGEVEAPVVMMGRRQSAPSNASELIAPPLPPEPSRWSQEYTRLQGLVPLPLEPEAPSPSPAPSAVRSPASLQWPSGETFVGEVDENGHFVQGRLAWSKGENRGHWYDGTWANGLMQGQGRYHWSDGREYWGEWHEGKMHGRGTLEEADGSFYSGSFANNLLHGQGRKTWQSGQNAGCSYSGCWQNGHMQGEGLFTWPGGDWYDGEWLNGRRYGNGKMVMKSGDRRGDTYQGQFHAGMFHGEGTYVWANGDTYKGHWMNGRRCGQGKMTKSLRMGSDVCLLEGSWHNDLLEGYGVCQWADGGVYEGEWGQGVRGGDKGGFGVRTWPNGARYSGWWLQGQMHGRGKYEDPAGAVYEGDWLSSAPHGYGRKHWVSGPSKGNLYEGQWCDGVCEGQGTFVWADGSRYDGEFVKGKCCGRGVMRWKTAKFNGDLYSGGWKDDVMHGVGKYIEHSGDVLEGTWVNGKRHGKMSHWVRSTGVIVLEEWNQGELKLVHEQLGADVGHTLGGADSLFSALRRADDEPAHPNADLPALANPPRPDSPDSAENSDSPDDPDARVSHPPLPCDISVQSDSAQSLGSDVLPLVLPSNNHESNPQLFLANGLSRPLPLVRHAVRKASQVERQTEPVASKVAAIVKDNRPFSMHDVLRASRLSHRSPFLHSTPLVTRRKANNSGDSDPCLSVRRSREALVALPLPSPGECPALVQGGAREVYLLQLLVKSHDEQRECDYVAKHAELQQLRTAITLEAKSNQMVEEEIGQIEGKIGQLVRNEISVQQIIADMSGLLRDVHKRASVDSGEHLKEKRELYTVFVECLLRAPRSLAAVLQFVEQRHLDTFVHTLVHTVFGNHYDPRIQHQLLRLIEHLLVWEFRSHPDLGTVMRANSVATKVLSAYCRKGEGAALLKKILRPFVEKIRADSSLMLDLSPALIYKQLHDRKEITTGVCHDANTNITQEEAAANPEVIAEAKRRVDQLASLTEECLERFFGSFAEFPFGMRWISAVIFRLAKEHFPEQDSRKYNSLVGGFLFLRYLNPALCTPDSLHVVEEQCTPAQRRNLVMIAKVIQNLSNDVLFGAKEAFTQPLNGFLADNTAKMQEFFGELVKVDNLDHQLHVESTFVDLPGVHPVSEEHLMPISLNELFTLHRLCYDNLDHIPDDDHADSNLRDVVGYLGEPPEQLPRADNRGLFLRVQPPDVSTNRDDSQEIKEVVSRLKLIAIDVLREVPLAYCYDLRSRKPVRPPPEQCDVTDLGELLSHPEGVMLFRAYLEKTFEDERLYFLSSLKSLIRQARVSKRGSEQSGVDVEGHFGEVRDRSPLARISQLYALFINSDSDYHVSIDAEISDALTSVIQPLLGKEDLKIEDVDLAPFRTAQEAVLQTLHEPFKQFLDHSLGQRWLAYVEKDPAEFCFSRLLRHIVSEAESDGDWGLADEVELLCNACGEAAILCGAREPLSFGQMFDRLCSEIVMFARVLDNIQRNVQVAKGVLAHVQERQAQLVERVKYYNKYLDNVRRGLRSRQSAVAGADADVLVQHFPYTQLAAKSVVRDSAFSKAIRKKLQIVVSAKHQGEFEIKTCFHDTATTQGVVRLEDLLEAKGRTVQVGDIEFSVNLLIHLLNRNFIAPMQKPRSKKSSLLPAL